MQAEFLCLPHQHKFVLDTAKHPGIVAGYGAGKTRAFVLRFFNELKMNRGVMSERTPGVLCEPTFPMTRDILLPEIEHWLRALGWRYQYNKAEHRLTIGDWGHVLLLSAENYTRYVGYNLCFFGVDEIDTIPADKARAMWRVMCSRLRVPGSTGTGFVSGTPEGYGFLYEMWDTEANAGRADRAQFSLTRASSRDNWHLPAGFVDGLVRSYDQRLVRAYVDGFFVNLTGMPAVYQFDRAVHVKHREPSPKKWLGMDFNVDPLVAVVWSEYSDGSIHAEREYAFRGGQAHTPEAARLIRADYPGLREVYPDPAGKGRTTASERSDHAILRDAGFVVVARNAAPAVRDRLAALNRKLKDGDGRVMCTVSPDCPGLIADLEQCKLDSAGHLDKSDSRRTHWLDACSYGVEYRWPVAGGFAQSIGGVR